MFEKYEKIKKIVSKPIPLYQYYEAVGQQLHLSKNQAWYALQLAKQDGHVTFLRKPGISLTILPQLTGIKTKTHGKVYRLSNKTES